MDKKIIRMPIGYNKRMKNKYGEGYVPCEVSGRWLQFPDESDLIGKKNLMIVDVMTLGSDEKPRKLCSLCISKDDIISALNNVKIKENKNV